MYYKEKIENGITYCQTSPNGSWMPMTNQELTKQILLLKQQIRDLEMQVEYYAQNVNGDLR